MVEMYMYSIYCTEIDCKLCMFCSQALPIAVGNEAINIKYSLSSPQHRDHSAGSTRS